MFNCELIVIINSDIIVLRLVHDLVECIAALVTLLLTLLQEELRRRKDEETALKYQREESEMAERRRRQEEVSVWAALPIYMCLLVVLVTKLLH